MKLGQAKVWFNGKLVSEAASVPFNELIEAAVVDQVCSLVAAAMPGMPVPDSTFALAAHAYLYQDDDAHETCSLTACLNPLHPGPCKGWKGTLFKTSESAYHALEAARVEKANANRLKKIQALKDAGKPIPKKLLQPIVAKPHPHAGKTANMATGEAHAAGQAVTDAAGVHVQMPGKMTLGQAVKQIKATDATKQLGPKGKKPTVASKGIAAVIAQEKVTPTYKLTKAEAITPEQWNALSHDEKAIIRGELTKIENEGFGPQQKKATELLAKLPIQPNTPTAQPKLGELTPGTPGTVTTPSGKTYQKIDLPKTEAPTASKKPLSEKAKKVKELVDQGSTLLDAISKVNAEEKTAAPKAGPSSLDQAVAIKAITEAIHGKQATTAEDILPKVDIMKKGGKTIDEHPAFGGIVGKLASAAQKKAYAEKMPDVPGVDVFYNQIADHIKEGKPGLPPIVQKVEDFHKPGAISTDASTLGKTLNKATAKPKHVYTVVHNGETITRTSTADYTHASLVQKGPNGPVVVWGFHKSEANALGTPLTSSQKQSGFKVVGALPVTKEPLKGKGSPNVKEGIEQAAKAASEAKAAGSPKLGELKPGTPGTITTPSGKTYQKVDLKPETPKIENVAEKPKELPKHVQHAIDLANHQAPGHFLSKNHLAAYQELTDEEFHALPSDVQAKMIAELEKGKTKFLDPKKIAAADKLAKHWSEKKQPHAAPNTHIPTAAEAAPAAPAKTQIPVAEMTPAQIQSRAAELLGDEAVKPNANLKQAELKEALATGHAAGDSFIAGQPDSIKKNPAVSAKLVHLKQDLGQLEATKASQQKLWSHLMVHHLKVANSGKDIHGNQLTPHDKEIISKSGSLITDDHKYLVDTLTAQKEKVAASTSALMTAVEDAKKIQTGSELPVTPKLTSLTDYDKESIAAAYGNAWAKAAASAVTYGVKSYSQKADMKAHPEYAGFTQDLGNLQQAVKKLALAHAEEHTAGLNVPVDPETGHKLPGPEKEAWAKAVMARADAEHEYGQLYKTAQAKLDTIRTDVGLKKRALPKIDSPAIKAAAAESGYYKSGGYAGPNYGKPSLAKNYMLAKVGPKLAVVHQTATEKKAEKLGKKAEKEAASLPPVAPVKLGGGTGDASIAHLAPSLKKQITQDFKGMPTGKYLQDPAEDVFGNLVNLAAAHGKNLDGGLSVEQVLKTIDETHAKNLGVPNSGMLEKKITDWLATPAGKQYAESHSTPNAKAVKDLLGEIDLPPGIKLEPGEKVQKVAGPGDYDPSIPSSAFHAHTSSSALAEQDAYMQAQGIKWSPDQKKAIKAYTGNGHGSYSTFNAYLRGEGSASAFHKQQILAIQAAMMPLQSHHLLKRGTGWPPELKQYASNPEALVGKTIEDPAFVSTSVAGSGGHFSGKPLQLIIEAPKGTAAAFINHNSQYKDSENEMLLAAGTKFKVISVDKTTGGHTVMRVRVVGGM